MPMKVYPLRIYEYLCFSTEALPPLVYGLSLIAIVGTTVSLYRHGRDMGALARGAMALLFLGGVALGAMAFLGLLPKEAI
jgi:hypothetical protein